MIAVQPGECYQMDSAWGIDCMSELSAGEQRALQLIAGVVRVDVDQLSLTSVAADHPTWDSMALVELVFVLQREYGIALQPHEATTLTKVSTILDVIRKAGQLQ
jgi:acyl carrier protein